jgi:hypothetical protein
MSISENLYPAAHGRSEGLDGWDIDRLDFTTADLALITKIDLAEAVEFDAAAALASVQSVRPGMTVLQVSARTGQGMDDLLRLLEGGLLAARSGAAAGVAP